MIKNLLLAFRILGKNKVLNLFLCLEVAIALFMINVVFNRIAYSHKLIDIVDNAHVQTSILFMGKGFPTAEEAGKKRFDTSLQEVCVGLKDNPHYLGVSNAQEFGVYHEDTWVISGTSFDNQTAARFKTKLKSGSWFTDGAVKNGRIPCVIVDTSPTANHYHVGDVIQGKGKSYDKRTKTRVSGNMTLEFEVTGIVDRSNAYIIRPGMSMSNGVQPLRDIFPGMYPDTVDLLCGELDPDFITTFQPERGILYFDESMSEEEVKAMMTELRKSGYVSRLPEMSDMTAADLTSKLKHDLPVFLNFLSISVIGLISIALLNSKKQMNTFSIYYLCGCKWTKSILIYFLYFGIILTTSFILYLIAMVLSYNADNHGVFYMYELTGKGMLGTVGICLLFSVVSTAIPFLNIKKRSLVTIYRAG